METVIIAYDGSVPARQALVAAGKLLQGCRIVVVTVWEPALASLMPSASVEGMMMTEPIDPEDARESDVKLENYADTVAHEGADLASALGLEAEPFAVPDERDVARTVIGLARDQGAAAIVVGSRGLSGLRAKFEGSTSKTLLTHSPCPVLVSHATE